MKDHHAPVWGRFGRTWPKNARKALGPIKTVCVPRVTPHLHFLFKVLFSDCLASRVLMFQKVELQFWPRARELYSSTGRSLCLGTRQQLNSACRLWISRVALLSKQHWFYNAMYIQINLSKNMDQNTAKSQQSCFCATFFDAPNSFRERLCGSGNQAFVCLARVQRTMCPELGEKRVGVSKQPYCENKIACNTNLLIASGHDQLLST